MKTIKSASPFRSTKTARKDLKTKKRIVKNVKKDTTCLQDFVFRKERSLLIRSEQKQKSKSQVASKPKT